MNYFVLFLLTLGFVSCSNDKDSLPGSYKLEKPLLESAVLNQFYNLNIHYSSQHPEAKYDIQVDSIDLNADRETIKRGTVLLKQVKKNEVRHLLLTIKDDTSGDEITYLKPIKTPLTEATSFEFSQDGISFRALARCNEEDCAKMRFYMASQNPMSKYNVRHVTFYVNAFLDSEAYLFKSFCSVQQSEIITKTLKEPLLIFDLNEKSSELKCIDL